jgi:hypothetical protein
MTPLFLALALAALADTEAPDGLAPLPPPPLLTDPDDGALGLDQTEDGSLAGMSDASDATSTISAELSSWRATLIGEGAVPGTLLLSLLGGGIGAGLMTAALFGLGVVFWGSLFAGGGLGSIGALALLPLAFAMLPITATAAPLVPRIFGKKTGRELLDAGVTFGLASAGTVVGAGIGIVASIVVGGGLGVAWLLVAEGDLGSLTGDSSSSFGLLYPILTTAAVIPLGTLVGAATLGTGGAVLAAYASTFAVDGE